MQSEPLVYIVIVNFHGWQDTLECLASLEKLSYRNYKIVVVDNASQDDSMKILRQHYSNLMLIESKKNLGFAGANNVGIREAQRQGANYIWLLNNDTVVDPYALTALVEKMEDDKTIGMCGSSLIYYANRTYLQARAGGTYHKWTGATFHVGEDEEVSKTVEVTTVEANLDYLVGASILVRVSLIEQIGLLPEHYFLYYEDVDWGLRAKALSRLGYAPDSKVYHKVGSSIGTTQDQKNNEKRFRSEYYSVRSRLLLTRTFYPYALPSVYASLWLRVLIRLVRGEWMRVKTLTRVIWLLTSKGLSRGLEQL
jgi:GT2 family glycosyltransferase